MAPNRIPADSRTFASVSVPRTFYYKVSALIICLPPQNSLPVLRFRKAGRELFVFYAINRQAFTLRRTAVKKAGKNEQTWKENHGI